MLRTLNFWVIMKISQNVKAWDELITLGSRINGTIHNPSQTYINIINTITEGVTNPMPITSTG